MPTVQPGNGVVLLDPFGEGVHVVLLAAVDQRLKKKTRKARSETWIFKTLLALLRVSPTSTARRLYPASAARMLPPVRQH